MLVTALRRGHCRGFLDSLTVRPALIIVALVAVSVFSTGCALKGPLRGFGNAGSQGIAADEQLLFDGQRRAPKQLYVQATPAWPKVDLTSTPEVQDELQRLLTRDRSTVADILAKGADTFGPMVKVLEGQGIPAELVSVAAVESGLNNKAASPAGAKGMWQFMKSTARVYGLRVEAGKDERTDFVRSTEAAAKHLRDLFTAFQDWHLALAAYNAGRGAIGKLMSRTGADGFWELARAGHLPGETKRFVPRVIAISMIVNNPDQYGFEGYKAVG